MSQPKYYTLNGETRTIAEWAEHFGIRAKSVYARMSETKQPLEDVLAYYIARNDRKYKYVYKDKRYDCRGLAKLAGISREAMSHRLRNGWPIEKAVETPLKQCKHTKSGISSAYLIHYGCKRFDCLHQDGDGKCQLKLPLREKQACTYYEDAYEYYFGGEVNEKTKAAGDPWERDRKLLLCGILSD